MSSNDEHNDDDHFTLKNIPFGVVSTKDQPGVRRITTRVRKYVYIFTDLIDGGLLHGVSEETKQALSQTTLNAFISLPKAAHRQIRQASQDLFQSIEATDPKLLKFGYLITDVEMHLPLIIGDFTDFSCSQNHVLNASEAMTGKRMMPPGFLHFPIGYTGRSSSIVVSNTNIKRSLGQYRDKTGNIIFGPSKQVDFELEVGVVIGRQTQHGKPVSLKDAEDHIFGLVLLNDWSARDIQGLEMNPLGPLNGKSFGTSISPWMIPLDAFQPFTSPAPPRDTSAPTPAAPYLQGVESSNHYSINLQVDLLPASNSPTEREPGLNSNASPNLQSQSTLCRTNFSTLYWPISSLVAHQTINGCPLSAGDILGTGTISGSSPGTNGCLLEATKGGKESVILDNGGKRSYLEDGDGLRITGWAGELGSEECVGFGGCFGRIEPALKL